MPSKDEAEYLVAALTIFPRLRKSALEKSGGLALFDEIAYPAQAMIWDVLVRMSEVTSDDELLGAVSVACELKSRNMLIGDDEGFQEALSLLGELKDMTADDFNEVYAERILDGFLVQAKKADIVRKLQEVSDIGALSSVVNGTAEDVAGMVSTGEPDTEMPLMDPDRYMPDVEQIPTGVGWIDYLSGGGHCPGEMIGVLGPQSGGKTLTATSILVAQAKRERDALLITYEQGTPGDVSHRLYTRLLDDQNGDLLRGNVDGNPDFVNKRVDVSFFRKYNKRQWPKVVLDRYYELAEKYGRYVNSLDFSKAIDLKSKKLNGTRGVADIDAAVQWYRNHGKRITYLIIDWLWPAVTRWFYNQNDKRLDTELKCATQFLYNLKQLTERENLITFVFHQLDNEHARAAPAIQPNVTHALNMHSFSQVMQHCYVIGNRDKESNVMWLGNDKARTGIPQYILGQMDGAMGVIDRTDGYELSRGRFLPKDQIVSEEEEDDRPAMNRYI